MALGGVWSIFISIWHRGALSLPQPAAALAKYLKYNYGLNTHADPGTATPRPLEARGGATRPRRPLAGGAAPLAARQWRRGRFAFFTIPMIPFTDAHIDRFCLQVMF